MDFTRKSLSETISKDITDFTRAPSSSSSSAASPSASSSAPPSSSSSSSSFFGSKTPKSSSPPGSSSPPASSASSSATVSAWSVSSLFTPYNLAIVMAILLLFGAWFAWDWYKTHHQPGQSLYVTFFGSSSATTHTTPPPIGPDGTKPTPEQPPAGPIGGTTVKPQDLPPSKDESSSSFPSIITTLSPMSYAKYVKDQLALETALGPANTGGAVGGEPIPDDAAAGAGSAGWCYIGEDQGYGVCASVEAKDKCMSGKVFPTESECRQNITKNNI